MPKLDNVTTIVGSGQRQDQRSIFCDQRQDSVTLPAHRSRSQRLDVLLHRQVFSRRPRGERIPHSAIQLSIHGRKTTPSTKTGQERSVSGMLQDGNRECPGASGTPTASASEEYPWAEQLRHTNWNASFVSRSFQTRKRVRLEMNYSSE